MPRQLVCLCRAADQSTKRHHDPEQSVISSLLWQVYIHYVEDHSVLHWPCYQKVSEFTAKYIVFTDFVVVVFVARGGIVVVAGVVVRLLLR